MGLFQDNQIAYNHEMSVDKKKKKKLLIVAFANIIKS